MQESPVSSRRGLDLAVLAIAAVATLVPFLGKAFQIDDPLFVWTARHIAKHPLDFYGFEVLWYSTWEPMSQVTQNPPLGCYYLAAVGSVFGWSEKILHAAMIVPAWAALAGVYVLAHRFGARPLPAALMTLATPVFLLSATSVMCDVPMLALWLWTLALWDSGLRDRKPLRLWSAGVLIAATTLTKYFGVCLLPLFAAYSLTVDRRGWRTWIMPLLLAVILLVGYQLLTIAMYGHGLLGGAMGYAASFGNASLGSRVFRLSSGLAFVGGCAGVMAIVAPALVGWRGNLLVLMAMMGTLAIALFLTTTSKIDDRMQTDSPLACSGPSYYKPQWDAPEPERTESIHAWVGLVAQFVIWAGLGMALAVLAWQDFRRARDAQGLLLALWIAGTFVFASYVNWSLNGRSVLPMIPALSIVLVRRWQSTWPAGWPVWLFPSFLAVALALSLATALADRSMADAQRVAAQKAVARFGDRQPLWFAGHWGFQYYMMELGAKPWDERERDRAKAGDLVIVPSNNCNMAAIRWEFEPVSFFDEPTYPLLTTMHFARAAGFYSEVWGPLPFAFGMVPTEGYYIRRLKKPDQKANASR